LYSSLKVWHYGCYRDDTNFEENWAYSPIMLGHFWHYKHSLGVCTVNMPPSNCRRHIVLPHNMNLVFLCLICKQMHDWHEVWLCKCCCVQHCSSRCWLRRQWWWCLIGRCLVHLLRSRLNSLDTGCWWCSLPSRPLLASTMQQLTFWTWWHFWHISSKWWINDSEEEIDVRMKNYNEVDIEKATVTTDIDGQWCKHSSSLPFHVNDGSRVFSCTSITVTHVVVYKS